MPKSKNGRWESAKSDVTTGKNSVTIGMVLRKTMLSKISGKRGRDF